jgi:hypothetical protein
MLGLVHRAAVMLDPIGDTLSIGEGVETCMAARQLGYRPAWAPGSVGAIAKFPTDHRLVFDDKDPLGRQGPAWPMSRGVRLPCFTPPLERARIQIGSV